MMPSSPLPLAAVAMSPSLSKQFHSGSRRAVQAASVRVASQYKTQLFPAPGHSANSNTPPPSAAASRPISTQSSSHLFKQLNSRKTANMSTMPAQHGHSEACCNVPPIVAKGYEAKGSYEELGGYKSYVTGPSDTTKGIVTIFDIFGYYPQTLQGADILSTSNDHQKYRVFMPDWFKGEPCPIEWFPPDNEEKQKNLGGFFQKNPPPGVAEKVPDYVKALQAKYPEIKEWAIIGLCWGGKVVSLVTSSPSNPFKAGVECHPAMVDPSEASKIKIPLMMLASKDEPAEDVKKFEAGLSGPKHVEIFGDQIHGWMGARADLEQDRVQSEYKRGYETVLKFLGQHV
ncbi:hypothetical protein F5Y15DRAFT_391708 [Xylariaceae sp. FL0016]|nr:hypothetical protein F5Y15DRAFT_391708 [Xylariaceae sp. FL0016]